MGITFKKGGDMPISEGNFKCKSDGSCGTCAEEKKEYKFDPQIDKPVWERMADEVKKPKAVWSTMDKQVGGNHYKDFPIQPTEFIMKNNLSFLQGCIIKRICRYLLKGDARGDLEKAKHEIDMIIELEGL